MDKILEGARGLTIIIPGRREARARAARAGAAQQPLEREQCLALLALGTRLYVSGADELPRRVGCQLLHVAGRRHGGLHEFSARAACCLLGAPGHRAPARWPAVALPATARPGADEGVCAAAARCCARCASARTAVCAQVARLLWHRAASPAFHRLLFCQQLCRTIGGRFRCPAEGEEGAVEFLEQAQRVRQAPGAAVARSLRHLPCLKEAVRRYLLHRCVCPGAWWARACSLLLARTWCRG